MTIFNLLVDFALNADKYLNLFLQTYGILTYVLLFVIIFCETGLVVTPFLPGDSLLFVAGALASQGGLNVLLLWVVLFAAAVLGDSMNYTIGHFTGRKVFNKDQAKFFKKEYLYKTQAFFEKHGGKTIVLARFMPVIRTFAPFVAGIGKMEYFRFLAYNVLGAFIWVSLLVFSGYFFGNLPIVKDNLLIFALIIIFSSVIPGLYAYIRNKIRKFMHPNWKRYASEYTA